ncbi:hypothetical protein PsorP6_004766 [Peronosclerospora sorghi]|uniref:Uncharacterized protein n=1 Tax=Peronosclerospora sorghi TaxID=230839 RepID=A0ACC0VMQ6_9STRA|nr:hypothetical protein PsorP6_004766 [Peronosclerospora sorghi]
MGSEDDEETGGAELRSNMLSIFDQQESDGENISGYYEVYYSKLLYAAKQEANIGEFGNISDGKVISCVLTVCAVNLQRIPQILHAVWAFSIVFDCGIKVDQGYIDVRLRFALKRQLFNIHLMAIPMHQNHTGYSMFQIISRFLVVLNGSWNKKLIGISTDGASNMTGRNQGFVTRLQRMSSWIVPILVCVCISWT